MKILTATNMYPTEKMPQFGIFVREQVESIRALGHEVDVCFVNARDGRVRHKAYLLGIPRYRKMLEAKPYDVVHAHYVFSGMIARFQRSTPLVLTHHGPELLHSWQGPVCRLTRGWADRTIVVAPWMVPVLGLTDVDVIPCGVDLSLFQPVDRLEARRRLGLDPAKRYILFAGNTWDSRKRFPLVREAASIVTSRHSDVELVTVCGQPHERIPLYMFAADVFAMTSTSEGSAQVVKEAMACDLPIVATDAGDNWDVIKDVDGCYRTGPDPAEIADRLAAAISPPRRTTGRARAERFGMDSIARRVVGVYERAVHESASRHSTAATRRPLEEQGR